MSADLHRVSGRKSRYRRYASLVQITSVALSAVSTVVLGLRAIDGREAIALPLVAAVTVLGTLDPWFTWRAR